MHAVRRGLAAMTTAFLAGLALTATPAAAATSTTPISCTPTGQSLQVQKVDGIAAFTDLSPRSRFDIDGDGRDEVIVSGYTTGSQWVVAVQMSRTASVWRILPPIADFGQSTIGDFNGDGLGDLAVTDSRGATSSPALSGSVWIFPGAVGGFDLSHVDCFAEGVHGVPGTPTGGRWGNTLAAGDLNGDGFADLAAGSQYKGGAFAGSVTLLRGGPSSPADPAGLTGTGATVITEASLGLAPATAGFGSSVAIGDLTGDGHPELVVGARYDSSGLDVNGRLFVFSGTASGPQLSSPTTIDAIAVSNPIVTADSLGTALTIGDVNGDGFGDIVASAMDASVDGHGQAGAITAFYGSVGGVGASRRTMLHEHSVGVAGDVDSAEAFGASISVGDVTGDGIDDVLVSAPDDTVGSFEDAGTAYLFKGSAQGLTAAGSQMLTQQVVSGHGPGAQHFYGQGRILDLNGSGPLDALVSATNDNVIDRYLGGSGGLTANGLLDTSSLIPSGQFVGVPVHEFAAGDEGASVGSVAGSTLYRLGASIPDTTQPLAKPSGATQIGQPADATEGGPTTGAQAYFPNGPAAAALSASVVRFDLDGDAHDDTVITGNPLTALRYSGLGRTDLLSNPYGSMFETLAAGDFNGDGATDLVLAAPGEHKPGRSDLIGAGGIWICPGSPDGLQYDKCLHWTQDTKDVLEAAQQFDRFGAALAAGDLNGDGYADLAVGVPDESVSSFLMKRTGKGREAVNAGAVNLFYGSPSGLVAAGTLLTQPIDFGGIGYAENGDHFGTSVAIGDVTGDGYADLAVGVPDENRSKVNGVGHFEGEVDLFAGGPQGITNRPIARVLGLGVGDNSFSNAFGQTLAIADTTGDGLGDVIVGAPSAYFGTGTYGAVVEYPATAAGITSATAHIMRPGSGTDRVAVTGQASFGAALATGDVTGDNRADLLVGAPDATAGGVQFAGVAVLLKSSATGLTTVGAQTLSVQGLASFGRCVAIVVGGAVVGAPGGGAAGNVASGAFVDYSGGGSSLTQGATTTAAQLNPKLGVLYTLGSDALAR